MTMTTKQLSELFAGMPDVEVSFVNERWNEGMSFKDIEVKTEYGKDGKGKSTVTVHVAPFDSSTLEG